METRDAAAAGADDTPARAPGADAPPSPRRLLLIDDDRLQYRLTLEHVRSFASGPYAVEWADSYETGLTKLVTGDYAACLLDYQLGPHDGLALIRAAVAAGCRTPIVFLTAETADRVDIAAMNAGALDYLVKGEITPRALERSLRYALKLGATLETLRQLATRDALTGLLNRREFDRILAEEHARALRFGEPLALLMVDLDHFKAINDRHGHPAGDAVLVEVARRLTAQVRTVDRVMRLGGEEFALLLAQTTLEGAVPVAERIAAALRDEPVVAGSAGPLAVTASVGVAALPGQADAPAALVAAADRALYAAKAAGRDRVVAAAP
ncbi:MAG: diguanylate cyclase [Opitutaceae bacterium]|nr:diguanylate cyclase [Opitutaceae bacterium]